MVYKSGQIFISWFPAFDYMKNSIQIYRSIFVPKFI